MMTSDFLQILIKFAKQYSVHSVWISLTDHYYAESYARTESFNLANCKISLVFIEKKNIVIVFHVKFTNNIIRNEITF